MVRQVEFSLPGELNDNKIAEKWGLRPDEVVDIKVIEYCHTESRKLEILEKDALATVNVSCQLDRQYPDDKPVLHVWSDEVGWGDSIEKVKDKYERVYKQSSYQTRMPNVLDSNTLAFIKRQNLLDDASFMRDLLLAYHIVGSSPKYGYQATTEQIEERAICNPRVPLMIQMAVAPCAPDTAFCPETEALRKAIAINHISIPMPITQILSSAVKLANERLVILKKRIPHKRQPELYKRDAILAVCQKRNLSYKDELVSEWPEQYVETAVREANEKLPPSVMQLPKSFLRYLAILK